MLKNKSYISTLTIMVSLLSFNAYAYLNHKAVELYQEPYIIPSTGEKIAPHIQYSYAPYIIRESGSENLHMFFCKPDNGVAWDSIGYASSSDDGISWQVSAEPALVINSIDRLDVSQNNLNNTESAACDPSVIYDPSSQYYYLYYTGWHPDKLGLIFVARNDDLTDNNGWEKYTGNTNWSSAANAIPQAVIQSQRDISELHTDANLKTLLWYGIGQSTLFMDGMGRIHAWYTDDVHYYDPNEPFYPSSEHNRPIRRIYHAISDINNPTSFPTIIETNVKAESIDVILDINPVNINASIFHMVYIKNPHQVNSSIVRRTANYLDLVTTIPTLENWSDEEIVCDSNNCLPDFSSNIGVERNILGHYPGSAEKMIVGFGAPSDLGYTNSNVVQTDFHHAIWPIYISKLPLRRTNPLCSVTVPPFAQLTSSWTNGLHPVFPSDNVIDENMNSIYSSPGLSSAYSNPDPVSAPNIFAWQLAAWFNTPSAQAIESINLFPRVSPLSTPSGTHTLGFPLAFPAQYIVYVTQPDNSGWKPIGIYDKQGFTYTLAGTSMFTSISSSILMSDTETNGYSDTYGILIVPTELGVDVDPNDLSSLTGNQYNYYFQLSEIKAHVWRECP